MDRRRAAGWLAVDPFLNERPDAALRDPIPMGQHAGETKIQQGGNAMKLISYVHGGSKGWGVVVEPDAAGGGIIPADSAFMAK